MQKAEEQHLADGEVPAHKTRRQRRTTSLEMKQIDDWLNLERARSSSARVTEADANRVRAISVEKLGL